VDLPFRNRLAGPQKFRFADEAGPLAPAAEDDALQLRRAGQRQPARITLARQPRQRLLEPLDEVDLLRDRVGGDQQREVICSLSTAPSLATWR
jgi:hypothetical protein